MSPNLGVGIVEVLVALIFLLVPLALLFFVIKRAVGRGSLGSGGRESGESPARRVLDERYARVRSPATSMGE